MQDFQATQTLRSVAWFVVWVTSIVGTLLLFAAFLREAVDQFGNKAFVFTFNPFMLALALGIIATGLFIWAASMALASITVSLLTLRDYFGPMLDERLDAQEDAAFEEEYDGQPPA